jgi:ABC-type polysaccharide/polyol phosphate transport system ATPase subunit
MPPIIEASDLSKSFSLPHEHRTTFKEHFLHPFRRVDYERNDALRGISFEVEKGEFFGVVGPNGSGKSTLLKILAGIYPPDGGELHVRGKLSPFIELGVGFNMELSARDNVRINSTLLGLSKAELRERYDSIVEFSELERFMDQKLKNFSSGMQVRLAYSIAIQAVFDILLLDEVLAVGDQAFQEKCFATFEGFRTAGKTVVFVSHDLESVRQYCQRTMLLEYGTLAALGPTDDVVDRYEARPHAPPVSI